MVVQFPGEGGEFGRGGWLLLVFCFVLFFVAGEVHLSRDRRKSYRSLVCLCLCVCVLFAIIYLQSTPFGTSWARQLGSHTRKVTVGFFFTVHFPPHLPPAVLCHLFFEKKVYCTLLYLEKDYFCVRTR